ncbi:unnamed protein product [Durusdinium trenchii]|uniref:Uncharacterized protein n=1 Tax=Durusdinium trenchii TaxID=1381693 RepID=A0ABP0IQZ9_9DINO
MTMALILAALALAVATVMGMVAAAVLAYFCWNGAMWFLESNGGHSNVPVHADQRNDAMNSWNGNPALQVLPNGRGATGIVPMNHEMVWTGNMMSPQVNAPMEKNRYQHQELAKHFLSSQSARPAVEEGYESPLPNKKKVHSAEDLSPAAVQMRGQNSRKQATVSFEDLQRGYAAHFAFWFNGDLDYHFGNVRAVSDAYAVNASDVCYCFLCLEEAARGSNLALKKWSTGSYAARVWLVALARFVKTAQRARGAQDVASIEPLCQEWGYNQDHFVREVQACEVPFQREHGRSLLAAFQTEEIRKVEVCRAKQILLQHAASVPVKGQRQLALEGGSLPKRAKALANEACGNGKGLKGLSDSA